MLNSGLVLVARTDAEAATMIDSNIAARMQAALCAGTVNVKLSSLFQAHS